jgi:hypothetical protein
MFKDISKQQDEIYKKCKQIAEERMHDNKITTNLTYDKFIERFYNVISIYWLCDYQNEIWNYFYKIQDSISNDYKLKVLLKDIYTSYPVDIVQFHDCLDQAIDNETQKSKSERYEENYSILHDMLDANGTLTIYRGVNQKSLPLELCVSWTYNPDVAKFFAIRGKNIAKVIKAKVNMNDILACYTDRYEHEVIIRSNSVYDKIITPIHMTVDQIEQWCSEWHKHNKAS